MEMTIQKELKVRMQFTRPYQAYKRGQIIDLPKGIARSFEVYGIAKVVPPEPQLEFAVAMEPVAEVAITPVAKAARRRKKQ
jgi:hypothetical protein